MNLDLLTLLENIVSGFVSFFYSLLRSLFETARRPVRGPLRLYRRYRTPRSRQIGGVTFLCLSFFLIFYLAVHSADLTPAALAREMLAAIQSLPETRARELWPLLVASLTGTIVIDAAIRIFLDIRHVRQRRSDLTLAASEYALFWAVPFAVVATVVTRLTLAYGGTIDPLIVLPLGIALILCMPAATLLSLGVRKRGRPRPGRGPWIAVLVGLWLLVFAAANAGFALWHAVTAS